MYGLGVYNVSGSCTVLCLDQLAGLWSSATWRHFGFSRPRSLRRSLSVLTIYSSSRVHSFSKAGVKRLVPKSHLAIFAFRAKSHFKHLPSGLESSGCTSCSATKRGPWRSRFLFQKMSFLGLTFLLAAGRRRHALRRCSSSSSSERISCFSQSVSQRIFPLSGTQHAHLGTCSSGAGFWFFNRTMSRS